jgi:galactose mutarotase-like enzyme
MEMRVTIDAGALTLETTLVAGPDGPVPASFGFHPYVGIPDLPRDQWRLALPAMRQLALDRHGIPTGDETAFPGLDAPLGGLDLDDGFAVRDERISLGIAGAGRRISVEFLAGYAYAQIFAPKRRDFVALEPMTAPTNALASGRGLRCVEAGGRFRAAFRIRIDAAG